MAREAYRSLYGGLTKLKDDSLLNDPAAGAGDDNEMFQLLLAVSDWVDHFCNRYFYSKTQTMEFDGTGSTRLLIPDLVSLTSLKEDSTDDQSFNETWAAGDYRLEPYNGEPEQHWGEPHTSIRVRQHGAKTTFSSGEQRFQIAGVWGYRQYKEDSGTDLNDAAMAATKITVPVDDGTQFAIGQTIMIGSEQMLITDISTNDLTVTRGLNGTTGVAHADNSDVFTLRWPASIERAVLIQASRIWTRAADFEPFFVDADVDTDVRILGEPYKRLPI
tara:strand:- start:446 stop:1267 length:822 start_codon:yes stop_codon:yes gene_type:complete